ncbi:12012_t:CDS:2, partial [Acaulospora colombiana]
QYEQLLSIREQGARILQHHMAGACESYEVRTKLRLQWEICPSRMSSLYLPIFLALVAGSKVFSNQPWAISQSVQPFGDEAMLFNTK